MKSKHLDKLCGFLSIVHRNENWQANSKFMGSLFVEKPELHAQKQALLSTAEKKTMFHVLFLSYPPSQCLINQGNPNFSRSLCTVRGTWYFLP
jgi:hypothetical protein